MCKDIILLLVGAAIGFISSVGIIVVERLFDRKGKLKVFYKFTNSSITHKPWNVHRKSNSSLCMNIPVAFELQNTSNTTRVIRDICIELFNGNTFVMRLDQVEYGFETEYKYSLQTGVDIQTDRVDLGTDNGSYSFVLPPRSIQKQKCEFSKTIREAESEKKYFDTIVICFYDEKDKKKEFAAKQNQNGWTIGNKEIDTEWQELK